MSYRQSPLRTSRGSRRPPAGFIVVLVALLVIIAGGAVYFWPKTSHHPGATTGAGASASPTSPAGGLARDFAAAWTKGDLSTLSYVGGLTGAEVQTAYK